MINLHILHITVEFADLLAERQRPRGQPANRPQSTRRQQGLFRRRLPAEGTGRLSPHPTGDGQPVFQRAQGPCQLPPVFSCNLYTLAPHTTNNTTFSRAVPTDGSLPVFRFHPPSPVFSIN